MAVLPSRPVFADRFVDAYYSSLEEEVNQATRIFENFTPSGTNKPEYLELSVFYAKACKIITGLHDFEERVRSRGNQLQAGVAEPLPNRNVINLDVELYDILYEHHKEFEAGYQKVRQLIFVLSKILQRCEPINRGAAEEKAFCEQAPDLHGEMKKAEEAFARTYLHRLKDMHKQAVELRDKLSAKLNDNSVQGYRWKIQRFSQIVANWGMPLGYAARAYNNIAYPVIPPLPEKRPEAQGAA